MQVITEVGARGKLRPDEIRCPVCCHAVKNWERHQQTDEHCHNSKPQKQKRQDYHLVNRVRMV